MKQRNTLYKALLGLRQVTDEYLLADAGIYSPWSEHSNYYCNHLREPAKQTYLSFCKRCVDECSVCPLVPHIDLRKRCLRAGDGKTERKLMLYLVNMSLDTNEKIKAHMKERCRITSFWWTDESTGKRYLVAAPCRDIKNNQKTT